MTGDSSGRNGEYWMVPMGLFFGLFAPLPFWLGKFVCLFSHISIVQHR